MQIENCEMSHNIWDESLYSTVLLNWYFATFLWAPPRICNSDLTAKRDSPIGTAKQ